MSTRGIQPTGSHMKKRAILVTLFVALICSAFLAPPLASAGGDKNVNKYTFAPESFGDPFPDDSGLIRASTKMTKKSTVIVCGYYVEPNEQYLGQFQVVADPTFYVADLEDFCLRNFDNRVM